MDTSTFKVVCDHCDAKLASVFCHSDGAFLCPQCDAQVHGVNKLAQRHVRVPCQSCPVWAYREAKLRGRLLDMPLAACLTRNLQMDIFDGTTPCWPSNNPSSAAMGTPQSDSSSPQPTAVAPAANAGSPNSPVSAMAFQQASSSWPHNGPLAAAGTSQPQPVLPQSDRPMSPIADPADVMQSAQFAVSPFSNCSGNLQASTSAALLQPQAPERWNHQVGAQPSTSAATQHQAQLQAPQSQHSQHTLQRAASQEVMDAVDSMDVALLLDTFGTPLDQVQEQQRKVSSAQPQQAQQRPQQQEGQQLFFMGQQQAQQQQMQAPAMCSTSVFAAGTSGLGPASAWPPMMQQQQQQLLLQQQLQMQQLQMQQQQQLLQGQLSQQRQACGLSTTGGLATATGFGVCSEPVAVPAHRQQQTMRTLSGLSCMSQSGLSSSNTDAPQLGSARSSNTVLLQSLEQQQQQQAASATGAGPATLAGVTTSAAGGWPDMQIAQRQLQQMQQFQQQQQQSALQALQQKEQAAAMAAAAAAQQQHQQQQAQLQFLQRSMTEALPRTSPINIGTGGGVAATTALAVAAARRDAILRSSGLGLSDPGTTNGIYGPTLKGSLPQQPTAGAASSACNLDSLAGVGMQVDPLSIAAAIGGPAGNRSLSMVPGPGSLPTAPSLPGPLPGSSRSLDVAASSFGAVAVAGSGGSTSVSPPNYNTLAGAGSERMMGFSPITSQQLAGACGHPMVLPGSAPPVLGLAAAVGLASPGGSCDLGEMRLSSDGGEAALGLTASASAGGMGMLGLGDVDLAGLLNQVDGSDKDLDPERAAQLSRYRAKRMMRMRALAEGAKKVRYECRKQLADTRPRVRGRFAKAISSDALADFCPPVVGGMPGTLPAAALDSNNGNGSGNGYAAGSACTAPTPGMSFSGSWGLHGHGLGSLHPHMQRIDEEGANEGQSPFMSPAPPQQHQHQQRDGPLRRAQSSSVLEGVRAAAAAAAMVAAAAELGPELKALGSSNNTVNCLSSPQVPATPCGTGAAAAAAAAAVQEDCVITDKDLAALGFDDLPQFSGGFSNAGIGNTEDMDESAESMHDGGGGGARGHRRPGPRQQQQQQQPTAERQQQTQQLAPQPSPQLQKPSRSAHGKRAQASPQGAVAAHTGAAPQPAQQLQQPQQRPSVLDRPIMYGTDHSQFSAAQLSLLDSILTDQYRPSGCRH